MTWTQNLANLSEILGRDPPEVELAFRCSKSFREKMITRTALTNPQLNRCQSLLVLHQKTATP
jgi:hypothetical protein